MNDIKQVVTGTVGCYTDGYLIDEDGEIFLISLFGTPTRVNAVKASILVGDKVCLQPCWNLDWQQRQWVKRAKQQFTVFNRKLASNVGHSLMYSTELKPDDQSRQKVFFGNNLDEIYQKFFAAAQKHYSTPLLADWTEWLWWEMEPEGLKALGFGLAYKIWFLDEELLEKRLFAVGSPIYRAEPMPN